MFGLYVITYKEWENSTKASTKVPGRKRVALRSRICDNVEGK